MIFGFQGLPTPQAVLRTTTADWRMMARNLKHHPVLILRKLPTNYRAEIHLELTQTVAAQLPFFGYRSHVRHLHRWNTER
jgi:hypothetical protein